MANITAIIQRLGSGFFGFWVQKRRVTILLIILIIALGIQGLVQIPKESAPQINLGLINVTTVYPGASPEDVDELITSKMETELSEVDGIKSLASTSSAGVSSVMVTVDDGFDSQQVLTDIKAQVDRVSLPSEATDPSVIDITTDSNGLFSLILYAPKQATTIDYIKSKAKDIAYVMKSHPDVADIIIGQEDVYDIRVIVDQNKAESIGLTSQSIASIINGYVSNIPLGNYQIDTAKYDYRINKTISNKEELGSVMIPTSAGSIPLQSIATIVDFYDEEVLTYYGSYDDTGYHYVSLAFEKPTKVIDIQSASNRLQIDLEELLTGSEFTGISYALTNDAAESITESNLSVLNNGVTTLVLVFVVVLFFVSFKEALIATLSIPLAFFITFFVLQKLGYTLNFLTNFSLIVTFGIAIDTIIVILEGATEKTKLGYNPYEAALLALHEYKTPLIAGTATTCVVFLPLFVLPGVLGKYLANIPITIFITLIGALLVSLLINPAVFFLVTPKSKQYINNEEEEFLDADEKALLAYHREKKTKKTTTDSSRRHQFFDTMGERYKSCIHRMVHASKAQKMMIIFLPIVGLVLSFFLGVGFTMFPESEAEVMNVSITGPAGSHISYFDNYHDDIESVLSSYPELKQYTYNVSSNTINIAIDLTDINLRKKIDERNSFVLQDVLLDDLNFLVQEGMSVEVGAQSGGPPGGKTVGIQLIAQNISFFGDLQDVADDFEAFFNNQSELIAITNSNQKTAGQFIFTLDIGVLQILGLTPSEVIGSINVALNGASAGTIAAAYDDHDIKVVYDTYVDQVTPQQVENLVISTSAGAVRVGDIADYILDSNINAIKRDEGNILITIEADLEQGLTANDLNPVIQEFADSYTFPTGVSYSMGGENEENAELLTAMGIGFMLALFLIFTVLLLQFNSFRMPLFIFYSIIMALLGANVGLWITNNPMSLAFMIGFFSLTGIVVNDAIVLIDRINVNISRGMDKKEAIKEAGKSRLSPILLTTITTILGLITVTQEDEFFAGLGYTIMFGLFVGSMMTLFVVPVLYDVFVREKKRENTP